MQIRIDTNTNDLGYYDNAGVYYQVGQIVETETVAEVIQRCADWKSPEATAQDEIIAAVVEIKPDLALTATKAWEVGEPVKPGSFRTFGGKLYRAVQPHTTQADWTPDITPALWVVAYAPDVIPDWVQPTGAHDAYKTGDKVRFEGKVYVSIMTGANSYSPRDYPQGWEEIV